MPWTIEIKLKGNPREWLTRIIQDTQSSGARFDGDVVSGKFSSRGVEGHYKVHGSRVDITITREPWYLPRRVIESNIRGLFAPGR